MRKVGLGALIAASFAALPAFAGSLNLPIDEVRVVTFVRPVSTVYVGNPAIADVNIIDSRHAFVLGKTYGATNIIALDANGHQVADNPLTVFGHPGSIVTLNRGPDQVTYACADSRCEHSPLPGDEVNGFENNNKEITSHEGLGEKEATAQTGQQH